MAIEVFLIVYQATRSYQAKGKFTTWLYKITINLCLDQKRKKERLKIISLSQPISTKEEKEEELIEEIPDSAPSPWEILQKKRTRCTDKRIVPFSKFIKDSYIKRSRKF